MNDAFELLDPRNAQAFLKQFSGEFKRKGEALFRRGLVENLAPEQPGMAYSAVVNDRGSNEVYLEYDAEDGWSGTCTCDTELECEHIFATMRTLLAEHSTAAVRNLSAGISSPASPGGKSAAKGEDDSAGLARRLMATLGRSLNAEETKFVRKLHNVFLRCQQTSHITHWDFNEIGFRLNGYGWEGLKIWPEFPPDEYQFWLYVANAALDHGLKIPQFMEPITDVTGVQERLKKWRRAREVERWKATLGNAASQLHPVPSAAGATDLRLVIGENEAYLQWRPPNQEGFQTPKAGQLTQLANAHRDGELELTEEAEQIWHLFSPRFHQGRPQLLYDDEESVQVLRRLLRMPALETRIVRADGQVLARPTERLRWEVQPAAADDDDYRVRLVLADGSQPPPLLCVMPGKPPLYLTQQALLIGPLPHEQVLKPLVENRIPAAAIESSPGLNFLESLGVDLPERVRDRVRKIPYQVTISCRLTELYHGSEVEDCIVNAVAEAPDGHKQTWTGYNWLDTKSAGSRKKSGAGGTITVYDRTFPNLVPQLLAPLNLKPSSYRDALTTRVSKKFPEIFATWLRTVPPQITVKLEGELESLMSAEVAGQVKLEVTEAEIDWFDLQVVLNVTDTTLTQEEIKLLLNAKGGYVRLAGKGWRRLKFDVSAEEDERLARLGLSTRGLSAEPQRLHALQLADDAAKKFMPEQQVQAIHRRASEIKARVSPALPTGVKADLRHYQLEGFHFLAYLATNRFGGILADDMGLGKTLQALAWLLWLRESQQNTNPKPSEKTQSPATPDLPSLVVCPKSVMDNWHAEAERFTPSLRVKSWPAGELTDFANNLHQADLHVINYNQLRMLGESLIPIRWQALILDEGQYIKNPSSQTAQIARALKAQQRLILSGTPIENRLMDLWSLMAFAMPGVLGSRAQFSRFYDAKGDPFARRRLASRVRPFLLRRTKGQVAKELPDRIEEDLFCEIEGEQKTLYRAELKRAQQLLLRVKTQKEMAQHQLNFLTSLLRLRQICCHPKLVSADSTAPSAKLEALLEQLEPLMDEGQKVLVFSQFVELLSLLRPSLTDRGWPVFYLVGATENRGELVRQFQASEGPGVFLISLKAGGFGLNLTAASYVMLFDPWWNPAVENQAIDRTHRIGQVNKVIAYRLLIKNSIEEKIRSLQKQKQALAEDVLGEERFAQSLTLQDLQFLFAD